MLTFVRVGLLLSIGAVFGIEAFAQSPDQSALLNRASQYHLGDKDQILMNVNVWGHVRRPGQYVVPRHTDLISLISFAGGPIDGANLSKVNIIRGGELLTASNGKSSFQPPVSILNVDVKKHMGSGEIGKIPILQAGDTVILPQSFGSKFEKILGFNSIMSIIAAMASIALIVERL